MTRWNQDPIFADVERIAEKIEQAFAKANFALHKLAHIEPGEALKKFAEIEGRLLRFDEHAQKLFEEALEEKRVHTLAHGDLIMTCVLSAAVALSEFKRQPQIVTSSKKSAKIFATLQKHSTTTFGLLSFATMAFYGVLGAGLGQHTSEFRERRTRRPIIAKKYPGH